MPKRHELYVQAQNIRDWVIEHENMVASESVSRVAAGWNHHTLPFRQMIDKYNLLLRQSKVLYDEETVKVARTLWRLADEYHGLLSDAVALSSQVTHVEKRGRISGDITRLSLVELVNDDALWANEFGLVKLLESKEHMLNLKNKLKTVDLELSREEIKQAASAVMGAASKPFPFFASEGKESGEVN